MMLEVVAPGLLDLVVDTRPRRGGRYGLAEAGPLDPLALRAANRLVGNPPDAAGLEILVTGPVLRAVDGPAVMAVTGAGPLPVVAGQPVPRGRPFRLKVGESL